MNQLQLAPLPKINSKDSQEILKDEPVMCQEHQRKIQYLIINEIIDSKKQRPCCEECIIDQKYQLLNLVQAKSKHLSDFLKVCSKIQNKYREANAPNIIFLQLNIEKILQACEIIKRIMDQIQNQFKQEQLLMNRNIQIASLSELNLFGEYIAQKNSQEQQERLCENYLSKIYLEIQNDQTENFNHLKAQIGLIGKNIQGYEDCFKSVLVLVEEDVKKQRINMFVHEPVLSDHTTSKTLFNLEEPFDKESSNQKLENCYILPNNDDSKNSKLCKQSSYIHFDSPLEKFTFFQSKIISQFQQFNQSFQEIANMTLAKVNKFTLIIEKESLSFYEKEKNILNRLISEAENLKRTDQQDTQENQLMQQLTSQLNQNYHLFLEKFSYAFEKIKLEYQMMLDFIKLRQYLEQINKAYVGSVNKKIHNNLIKFNLEDKQINYLDHRKQLFESFTVELKNSENEEKIFKQSQVTKLFVDDITNFHISQDSSWFVIQSGLDFLCFFVNVHGSYKMILKTEVAQVEQLEIDSNTACFSFHKQKLIIWEKKKKFNNPQTIYLISFVKATFNQQKKILVVQQNSSADLDIYQFNSEFKISCYFKMKLTDIDEQKEYIIQFFENVKETKSQFLMTSQRENLFIHKIDLMQKKLIFLKKQVSLGSGQIFFCQSKNILGLVSEIKNEIMLILYAVKLKEEGLEQFVISQFSILVNFSSPHNYLKTVEFSPNGKFIVLKYEEQMKFLYSLNLFLALLPDCQEL